MNWSFLHHLPTDHSQTQTCWGRKSLCPACYCPYLPDILLPLHQDRWAVRWYRLNATLTFAFAGPVSLGLWPAADEDEEKLSPQTRVGETLGSAASTNTTPAQRRNELRRLLSTLLSVTLDSRWEETCYILLHILISYPKVLDSRAERTKKTQDTETSRRRRRMWKYRVTAGGADSGKCHNFFMFFMMAF